MQRNNSMPNMIFSVILATPLIDCRQSTANKMQICTHVTVAIEIATMKRQFVIVFELAAAVTAVVDM